MYTNEMLESMKKVEAARAENAALEPRRMTAEEKDSSPEHLPPRLQGGRVRRPADRPQQGRKGPHGAGRSAPGQQPGSNPADIDLENPDYDVDVLIIGGGGAGASAAIEADNAGAKAMIVTKLRMGDANTMMAEGGIQAADKPNDSPAIHYLDAFGGGHFAAKPELLYKLVTEAPEAIQWLNDLGVEFDKEPDGTMITTHGGGTSRKRMHAAKDYSGAEIMRTLRDEVLNRGIPVVDFTAAIELILDDERQGRRRGPHEHGDQGTPRCQGQDRHHRHRRCGTAALPGLPHLQPLRRYRRRSGSGLPGGRQAPLRRHPPVPSHRRRLPRADLRRAGHRKGPLPGRQARQRGRRSLHAPAGDPRRFRRLHHPGVLRPAARASTPPAA